ncbi:unnamed protein product, partial [Discosporangium mesarthrocarpum]
LAAADAGDGLGAVMLLNEMQDEGMRADESAYHLGITACGRAGLWRPAMRLLETLANEEACSPSVRTVTSAIRACLPDRRWAEAVTALQEARPAARMWAQEQG